MAKFQVTNQGSNGTLAVFFADGTSKTIQSNHPSYVEVITYLVATPEDEHDDNHIKEISNPALRITRALAEVDPRFSTDLFRLYFEGIPVEGPLANLIKDRLNKQDADWERFVRFAASVEENPSFEAKQGIYSWVTTNGLTILPDGRFVAHKGVSADGFSVSKGPNNFINGVLYGKPGEATRVPHAIGSVVSKRRGDVDDSRVACSTGLHVGTLKYAKDFGPRFLTVAVEAKDVVGGDQGFKIRVCKYEVLALNEDHREFSGGDYVLVDRSGEVSDFEVRQSIESPTLSRTHVWEEGTEQQAEYNGLPSAGRRLYDNLRTQFAKSHQAAYDASLAKFGTYQDFLAKQQEERDAEAAAAAKQAEIDAEATRVRLAEEAAAAEDERVQAAQQALTEGRSNAEEDVVAAQPTEASSDLTLAENAALLPELAKDLKDTSLGHKPLARKWSHLTTESSVRRYRKANHVNLTFGAKVRGALS